MLQEGAYLRTLDVDIVKHIFLKQLRNLGIFFRQTKEFEHDLITA
jgi:hypothetical protein